MSAIDSLGRRLHGSYERWNGDDTRDRSWVKEAACRGADTRIFFTERGESIVDAQRICRGCPVRQECGDYGMGERFGVWGGLSELGREVATGSKSRNRRAG